MSDQQDLRQELTPYELMGGAETIRRIVEAFYPLVQANSLIGPLFPENIHPVMEKQYMFLTQFFGGPPLYSNQYGHPMMRARHLPFEITPERAEAWLGCMRQALDSLGLEAEVKTFILERLKGPAYHFINKTSS
ncbi:globin [Paenibacillus doosanensis]|uniref:Group 2 truncated hemoglobin YjbI n=1 Tax=Paenibacillus konkukensis TaxID=2020716 RepID=A0ABY4RML3_9BACL|nr:MULTISPECIES: globin [Paenibacillus]MCS7463523.1 globin [Paenibacillus doosanensis]UQZ83393.1 Group 2 truncated hemoglobin YjbI [Paenibacillus konkukensis]